MEKADFLAPAISVILPAMLGVHTVAAAIHAWELQQADDEFEILVLCPTTFERKSGNIRYLGCASLLLHEARAMGVREARAPYVLIAEDHCLPEPGSIASILKAIEADWDAIGPIMAPGKVSIAAVSSFILGYGQWMEPVSGGKTRILPGHNVVLRRDYLLELRETLEVEMIMCSFLIKKMHREGRRLALEKGWRMRHYDPDSFVRNVGIFWYVGMGFGAARTRFWPAGLRYFYPLAVPVAVARHWLRGVAQFARVAQPNELRVGTLGVMALYALISGFAEAVGGVRGIKGVEHDVWRCEIKPVTFDDIVTNDPE